MANGKGKNASHPIVRGRKGVNFPKKKKRGGEELVVVLFSGAHKREPGSSQKPLEGKSFFPRSSLKKKETRIKRKKGGGWVCQGKGEKRKWFFPFTRRECIPPPVPSGEKGGCGGASFFFGGERVFSFGKKRGRRVPPFLPPSSVGERGEIQPPVCQKKGVSGSLSSCNRKRG